jgi:Ca2+-binding RTX toxin-like protein
MAGADTLIGGTGGDTLTGGTGDDNFVFDTTPGGGNVDDITDFAVANDTISLDRAIFTGIVANGTLAASAFRTGSTAVDGDDRIIYDSATGEVFYDADGVGGVAQILFATVDPGTALTNADFVGFI